jgi:hypothetical protein
MSEIAQPAIRRGQRLVGSGERPIGTVDAVFADYLLVRTGGLLPVDLYIPMPDVEHDEQGRLMVQASAEEAYQAWHRPLKRAPHE